MLLEFMKPIRRVGLAVVGLTCFVVHSPIAVAQHGEAEAGLYTFDYHGDTWTGTLTALDHEGDAITLTYEHKGKSENFIGVFKHPLEVVDQYGQPTKTQTHLQIGDGLTVYYIAQGKNYSMREDDGKRHKRVATDNLIFKIKLLAPPKDKH
jgi:hypothetical protein